MANTYTEARKRANEKYMAKLTRLYVWCTPEEKKAIETKAKDAGQSVNQYVLNKAMGT